MEDKNIMSEEAFNELMDNFEYVKELTLYGRKNVKHHVGKVRKELKEKDQLLFSMEEYIIRLTNDYNRLVDKVGRIYARN